MLHELVVLVSTLFISTVAVPCNDFDASLCALMTTRIPEICTDPCLSKYCKRSCGICPLQCYNCSNVAVISTCSSVTNCPDKNDYCFAVKTFSDQLIEGYKLGCASRQICQQYSSKKKRGRIEAGCCNTEKCNNKPPPLLHLTQNKNTSTVIPSWNLNVCEDKDETICNLFSYFMDPCSDDCVATKLCPKRCKKCFTCLNCYEVKDPSLCTQTTACGAGKLCYGIEKLGSDFAPAVQLGCIDEKQCRSLQSPAIHIFGKRDFSFDGNCCSGDRCNAHPLSKTTQSLPRQTTPQTTTSQRTTTTKATTSTTLRSYPTTPSSCHVRYTGYNCPTNYKYDWNECYLHGTRFRTKTESEQKCSENCGKLVSFQTEGEMYVLRYLLEQKAVVEVLTDMERDDNNNWYWRNDGSPVSGALLPIGMHVRSSNSCAVAFTRYNFNYRTYAYGFRPVSCNDAYRPLCRLIRY